MRSRPGPLRALSALLATLLVTACHPAASDQADDAKGGRGGKRPTLVKLAAVERRTVPLEQRTVGTVQPLASVAVRAQIGGVLQAVMFKQGQRVQKGDALFQIDARPLEATLRQLEALQARDLAQLRLAERQFERYTQLYKQGGVSEEQYDQLRASLNAQRSTLAADQANVENAKLQLSFATIRSPISGQTGSFQLTTGNLVRAADAAALVTINQLDPVQVVFTLPERLLPEIQRYRAAGTLGLSATPTGGASARGTLSFVDNAVDATTGTIGLRGVFDNPDSRLWPGATVEVRLKLADEADALVIPAEALQDSQQGTFVYVARPDRTVEARPVVVARTFQGQAVVRQGLKAGEQVVTDGQLGLTPGASIRLPGEKGGAERSKRDGTGR